jgi:hypothetical protein
VSMVKVNIAKDFSRFPAGRYKEDGPFPGQVCREKLLVPPLRKYEKVQVELDGTRGYGSSFLEEAFGGLIRESGFSESELKQKLEIITADSARKDEIWTYIKEAEDARKPDSRAAHS